jgi:hypothetical protein
MKAIVGRLRRLENHRFGAQGEEGPTLADLLRERLCRQLAQERGVSFEEALREHLAEQRAFWADYAGDGTIVDILRHALWPNAQADQTAQRL